MIELTIEQCNEVNGGFLPAIVAFVVIFTLPKIIEDHAKHYNQWGEQLGETLWEYNHPYDPNK